MAQTHTGKYGTAEQRWAGFGPYYAMFPNAFAQHVVKKYTKVGQAVLDPFSGRGTAPYSAAINSRIGIGIEINPVGWVYSKAKLFPAPFESVAHRIDQLQGQSWRYRVSAQRLPEFFRHCFAANVLQFLLAAREQLQWRVSRTDWTTMGLILVHLHGKRSDSLSNQMRQTKSLSPHYAIRWWNERGHLPPELDPAEFLRAKLRWRYAKGRPTLERSQVYLGDSCNQLSRLSSRIARFGVRGASLLFTSPPYCGVTNYHYDQWIRLWMLGGRPCPTGPFEEHRGKFADRQRYKLLLEKVFEKSKPLLTRDATVYVRTDSREITLSTTVEVLRQVFPKKRLWCRKRPLLSPSQTSLFGGKSTVDGEVDIVLRP